MKHDICVGDHVIALCPKFDDPRLIEYICGIGKRKPDWLPEAGVIGEAAMVETDSDGVTTVLVQWPYNSTNYLEGVDQWWCPATWLEKIENSQE